MSTGSLVTRTYQNFRGVDFRGQEIPLERSPDALNVWKVYKKTQSICTRPGMQLHTAFDAPVYGIFFYKDEMLVHSGSNLYALKDGQKTLHLIHLSEAPSQGFIFEDTFYFKDATLYGRFDDDWHGTVIAYVPTTSIGRKPSGGGTVHEAVNLLHEDRINTFVSDGISTEYYLDTQNLDPGSGATVKVNDILLSSNGYTLDYEAGKVIFPNPPALPKVEGQDNVWIRFTKTVPGYRERIHNCTVMQVFDNRVFFSGNPDYPNVVWHSALNDPSYVRDIDYYREGMDQAKVKSMVAANNALWVFREPNDANTNIFYHTPVLDPAYGRIYPCVHSGIALGCAGRAVNFQDDLVFFSQQGMEGITGDITSQQATTHRSAMVDRKLTAEPDYSKMLVAQWEGYLMVFCGKHVYLADSRSVFSHDGHREYDWFYWELEKPVTCVKVHEGVLYLGTADGIYTLTDENAPIESYWTTPKDKFLHPNRHKSVDRQGCLVEAAGNVQVFARLDDGEFYRMGSFEGVNDYFVCRLKGKKFKDIQLKFHSDTRFSLENVTLACWIGGHIKR